MIIHRLFQPLSLGALALSMLLASCDSQGMVAGGSDETHSSIDIQGRVLTKDARPYGNVIVRLRGLGLQDTTDSDGLFRFQRDSMPVAARTASAVDTIDYMRDGQTVLSAAVPAWIATMPDVMLVQRDLSGQLSGPIEDISRVVCELGAPDGYHHELDLELNPYTKRYSGFAYFRYTGGSDSFTVWVKTLDDSGRMLGRSRLLRFSSKAGDIAFPEFGANNAVPTVRIRVEDPNSHKVQSQWFSADTMDWRDSIGASGKQKLHLHALVVDSFRRAARVEWNLGNGWVKSSASTPIPTTGCPVCYRDTAAPGTSSEPIRILYHFDTTISVPAGAEGSWRPMVRVVDAEGNTTSDTLKVAVVAAPPFASVWLTSPSEVLPGAKLSVSLDDSDSFGGKVVSRKLYLGRYSETITSSVVSCIRILFPDTGWSNRVIPWTGVCDDVEEEVVTRYFHPLDTGRIVSGADTSLTLPKAETGIFQALYEVMDDDGNKTVIRSGTVVVRPVAPRVDSIVAGSDSVDVHWTTGAEILTTSTSPRGWKLQGSWKGSFDTFAIQLDWETRKARIPRPDGAYALDLRIRQLDGIIVGFPRDTTLATLPKPVLSFTGAALDPRALRGAAFVIEPASARLFGTTGAFLTGDVARLDWAVGDSFAMSAAGANFRLVPTETPTILHLDVANHSSLPVRIFLHAPSNGEYSKLVERRVDLGWNVPAGFKGRLDLALDSATWSLATTRSDSGAVDRKDFPAELGGVGFRVVRPQEPVLRSGILEIDNIAWE